MGGGASRGSGSKNASAVGPEVGLMNLFVCCEFCDEIDWNSELLYSTYNKPNQRSCH